MLIIFLFLCIFPLIYIYRSLNTQRHSFHEIPCSPTSVTSSPEAKYDVFLSFRGEDTRDNFTSHLYAALCSHNISTFIDDKLERGEEISQSLLSTIQGSKLSVIIFSENYASSKWCLEELVKILECQKKYGQAVIPIFYWVDPSDVRKQKGSYGDAFAKHRKLSKEKVQRWRAALEEAANLSGLDSHNFKLESEFVKEIVRYVFNKLYEMSPPSKPKGLVGIIARIKEIESLLNMGSQDVRIVGIWGMAGIGKTTLAKAVFDRIYAQFEGSCFLEHAGDKLDSHGAVDLQKILLSQILDRDGLLNHPLSSGNSFIKDLLCRRKVLIVLDDVWSFRKLEELLLLRNDSFGAGSKIIVTSRDKQVLNNAQVDETYEVKRLKWHDARRLFCQKAFKSEIFPIDYTDLLERAESYAQGNPLALTVLGATLYGSSKDEWHSALNKLALDPEIHNVLRISYDKLDPEQQEIFLNFAHYFRGLERNYAIVMLDALHGRSVLFDINKLIDKCLITVSQNASHVLQIHDLVHLMAYSIGRSESTIPGRRKRLCDPEDIFSVLTRKKGSEQIEGISLDMSKLSREMHLSSDAFARMDALRFLKFYSSSFSEDKYDKVLLPPSGLEYISDELICFHWIGFPSRSLPPNFCAENLIDLDLSESKVVELWGGLQNLVNLRIMDVSDCPCLMKLPDLSMACNLEKLSHVRCTSLIEVPSFVEHLRKLKYFFLAGCNNLRSLPKRISSKVLEEMDLSWCSNITKCPEISANIRTLDIRGTAIEEIPESNRVWRYLDLSCLNVTKFPEVSEEIMFLHLRNTAIKELPSSIQFLTSLKTLNMEGSTQLSSLPISICKLKSLEHLCLRNSLKLESFPDILEPMESLKGLYLKRTAIKELPSSFKNLIALEFLDLRGTPIKELPVLPSSLLYLVANDCESLEILSSTNINNLRDLNFANCFKLDQEALRADMQFKIQSGEISYKSIKVLLPGSEIPRWFCYDHEGSSVTVQLPSNCRQLKGIAFCLVFSLSVSSDYFPDDCLRRECSIINFFGHAKIKNGENDDVIFETILDPLCNPLKIHDSDHTFLQYMHMKESCFGEFSGNEVTFEFCPMEVPSFSWMSDMAKMQMHEIPELCKVKRCGVYFLLDENLNPPCISDEDLSDQKDCCLDSSSSEEDSGYETDDDLRWSYFNYNDSEIRHDQVV